MFSVMLVSNLTSKRLEVSSSFWWRSSRHREPTGSRMNKCATCWASCSSTPRVWSNHFCKLNLKMFLRRFQGHSIKTGVIRWSALPAVMVCRVRCWMLLRFVLMPQKSSLLPPTLGGGSKVRANIKNPFCGQCRCVHDPWKVQPFASPST